MPVGKCEGHPLQRTEGGKKTFTSIVFHLFTWGFSSHLSEKRVHYRSPGFHKHGLPLFTHHAGYLILLLIE